MVDNEARRKKTHSRKDEIIERFRDVRAFIAVAETGSFSAAPVRLGVSPAYVSKLIGKLESELKVQLLYRATRETALTDAGRTYLGRAKALLEEFDSLHLEVADHVAISGMLSICIPRILARSPEVEIINFAELHPGLAITVSL